MQRLCMSRQYASQFSQHRGNGEMNNLSHVRVDDNGNIIAVFNDATEMDVSSLFSAAMIDDFKDHEILIHC